MRAVNIALLNAFLVVHAGAQQVVPVHQEPRHHVVLERPDLQVLDVRIPAGDTTLFHTHSTAIHYVMVGSSTTTAQVLGREWPRVVPGAAPAQQIGSAFWSLEYATTPLTHRVANIGSGEFRLIAVTNRGTGNTNGPSGLPGTMEAESQWFRRSRLVLEAGASAQFQEVRFPVVLIMVTEGTLQAQYQDSNIASARTLGGWLVLDPGRSYTVRNTGGTAVTVVVVEVLK